MANKGLYNLLLFLLLGVPTLVRAGKHRVVLPSAYVQPSFVVNEDSTVSFSYCGPCKRVSVLGDFQYTGKDSTRYSDTRMRKIKMQRGSDGCFHATTKKLVPETYTYCFRVDGKHKTDSYNNDTAWQMMYKWNLAKKIPQKLAHVGFFLYLCSRFQKCSFSRLEQPLVAVHSNVLQHPASPRNRLDPQSRFYKAQ